MTDYLGQGMSESLILLHYRINSTEVTE